MTHDRHKPDPCHYDRHLAQRVTRRHRDDCKARDCEGCAPCTAPHCRICRRGHLDNTHPVTCTDCVGRIRRDLAAIRDAHTALRREATDATVATPGGITGRPAAAAPIPGGDAQVLIGPTVRLPLLRYSRTIAEDHRPKDPIPPLAILAQWELMWRLWLGHQPTSHGSVARACAYLRDDVVPVVAQDDPADGGPSLVEMARQLRKLRDRLERAVHDEREPERGVACFECGDSLVRRFRAPRVCRHWTPARAWWATVASYAANGLRPTAGEAQAARAACEECAEAGQGGIADPRPAQSWECPSCRKQYDPGEYATAVRRSLADRSEESEGLGWCTLPTAAEAASDITGRPITASTIRTWAARGDDVGLACLWRPGQRFGVQLVFWPDVLARATSVRARGRRAKVAL